MFWRYMSHAFLIYGLRQIWSFFAYISLDDLFEDQTGVLKSSVTIVSGQKTALRTLLIALGNLEFQHLKHTIVNFFLVNYSLK